MSDAARAEGAAGPGAVAFACACAAYALFHLYTSFTGPFDPLIQRGVFIAGGVFLAFWLKQRESAAVGAQAAYVVLGLVGLYGGIHVIASQARFMDVMNDMTTLDLVVGFLMMAAIVVGTQRLLGWALPVLATISVLYYAFGHRLMSGLWQPPRASLDTVVSTLYASTSGIFGFMADIGTSVIAVYVIFGALLMATGAGEVFVQVAQVIAGRGHGGPAKVAVVTSALFGTVSGSAVANVMAVGSLTIPTMRRAGYPKALAAGVEASASAGGQIMPPIMGAGAFLMAELLNIPYLTIAQTAALPGRPVLRGDLHQRRSLRAPPPDGQGHCRRAHAHRGGQGDPAGVRGRVPDRHARRRIHAHVRGRHRLRRAAGRDDRRAPRARAGPRATRRCCARARASSPRTSRRGSPMVARASS